MTTELPIDPAIRILKSGTCPTLNGKSRLTYQFGGKSESEIAVRVTSNSGGGFWSKEWLPMTVVEKAVKASASKWALTSGSFRGLYKGRSVNTAGFLLAVLKHEGAVQRQKEKVRLYEEANFDGFYASLRALMRPVSDKASAQGGRAQPTPKKAIQKASAKRG